MATKIKFNGTGDGETDNGVHFVSVINDYTLCGITLDGDSKTSGEFDKTNKKVDCDDCKRIVLMCKNIRNSEF